MRLPATAIAIGLLCACGTSSDGAGSGSGGGSSADAGADGGASSGNDGGSGGIDGGASDGGAVADGGTIDGGTTGSDGGTIGGGGSDGGTIGGAGSDGGTVASDCDGIEPASLGSSVTARVPTGSGEVCWDATSDESGNVAAEAHSSGLTSLQSANWQIFSPAAGMLGALGDVNGDFFPQGSGFHAIHWNDSGETTVGDFVVVSPDGTTSNTQLVSGDDSGSIMFRVWGAGSIVAEETFEPVASNGTLVLRRFTAAGALAVQASHNNGSGFRSLVNVPSGETLVLFRGDASGFSGRIVGQWLDASFAEVTGYFDVAADTGESVVAHALVSGEAVVQVGGVWIGSIASGATTVTAKPAWLADGHDFSIVRGEKAYALIPKSAPLNQLELVSAQGNVCGTVTFPGVGGLTTGADGTVIGAGGSDGCSKTWWSGLLK